MSENIENNRNNMKITVDVDSKTLEDKIQENLNLKSENEQLKADLTLIAEKELQKQSKIYNCEPTVEALTAAKTKGSTALLNEYQVTGGNTQDGGWDSTEDMILDLNRASIKEGNKKATDLINKLSKKVLEKPINFEYEGKISDLARKPIKGHVEKQEDYDARLATYKKQQRWKDLNSVSSMESDV